jgi:hypothetical protein
MYGLYLSSVTSATLPVRMPQHEFFPRAPRLPLRAPLAVRASASMPWAEGWTVNISRSGVLFALPGTDAAEGDVEFVISLSRGALQGPGVPLLPDLHCRGRIIRVSPGQDGQSIVAATIRRQSLRHGDGPTGRTRTEPTALPDPQSFQPVQ